MLVVADGVGCTDTLTIDVCTGDVIDNPEWPVPNSVDEKIKKQTAKLKVYPNPFNNSFHIVISNPKVQTQSGQQVRNLTSIKPQNINLYDLFGKKVDFFFAEMTKEGGTATINASHLSKGIYIVEVKGVGRTKIIKH